jgi:bacillaene synthase trans-acting acyltransferase
MRDYCWDTISKPVNFSSTIVALEAVEPHLYIDVSPSGTLASFVKSILAPDSMSRAYTTLNRFGRDLQSIARLKSELS